MTLRVANLASSAFPATVTDLTVTNNLTLSAGTANGVLFLNGSKVVTSGSALTFDGSVLQIANPSIGIFSFFNSSAAVDEKNYFFQTGSAVGLGVFRIRLLNDALSAGVNAYVIDRTGTSIDYQAWSAGSGEAMRLNSTGLGIGTSNPIAKVNAVGAFRSSDAVTETNAVQLSASATAGTLETRYGTPLIFGTNASEKMRLDTSGNLGIGRSPSYKLDVAGSARLNNAEFLYFNNSTGTAKTVLGYFSDNNTYLDAADGNIIFRTGGGPSEQMRLDASGNLGLEVTPSAWGSEFAAMQYGFSGAIASYKAGTTAEFMHVISNAYNDNTNWRYIRDGAAARYEQNDSSHKWFTSASGTTGNTISFTQAMTLDASGNLLIGTTSSSFNNGSGLNVFRAAATATVRINGGSVFELYSNATAAFVSQESALPLIFRANAAERARIDSAGNVVINTAAIATNATDGFLYVPTCAGTPTGTPTTYTGRSPIVVDTTNNKLYFYSGGQWRDAGP